VTEERTLFQDGTIAVSTREIRTGSAVYAPRSVSAVRVDVVRSDVTMLVGCAQAILGFAVLSLMFGYGCYSANDAGQARMFGFGCLVAACALIMYGRSRPKPFGVFATVDGREVVVCSSLDKSWSDKVAAAIWEARG
jgi:hypothetical protein